VLPSVAPAKVVDVGGLSITATKGEGKLGSMCVLKKANGIGSTTFGLPGPTRLSESSI
jgi:hypothetical protein